MGQSTPCPVKTFVFSWLCIVCISAKNTDFVISLFTDGTYSISIQRVVWFQSAPTYFVTDGEKHSSPGGDMKLVSTTASSGQDLLGQYETMDYHYRAGSSNVNTTIKTYPDSKEDFIIFQQHYDSSATQTNVTSYDDVISCFPNFKMFDPKKRLGYLEFAGDYFGDDGKIFGQWNSSTKDIKGGLGSGPLAIFDENGHTVIISPFSKFMAASMRFTAGDSIGWGIMGGVREVPKGYQYDTIVYYADGINKAFEGWGRLLREWYEKKVDRDDSTLRYMGYWTNHGAFYYYNIEPDRTYEETVVDLIQYANNTNIPYGYLQLDSWWYTKGVGNGTKTWEPKTDIFPGGFWDLHDMSQMSIALNNRYWSRDTTYAIQNGGQFAFVIECESLVSLPIQQEFWDSLFQNTEPWGFVLYEQDWLIWNFHEMESFKTNLILGKLWLNQMATSAQKNKLRIQYSMSYPREAMQSLEFFAVTQARVSSDYIPGRSEQWRIGVVSLFAAAMGIKPYKDTFWTTEKQPGNPYNLTEPYPELQALVSVLSTGPVGPSDRIGYTNKTLLMRCCTSDGQIIKPGKPATAIDRQIIQRALFPGDNDTEIWTTHTIYDAVYHNLNFGVVFVVNPPPNFVLKTEDLDFIVEEGEYMYYEYPNISGIRVFDKETGIKLESRCTKKNPCLYHFVQKLDFQYHGNHTYYILGELEKWIPMSQNRVATITPDMNAEIMLDILGAPHEDVTIRYIEDGELEKWIPMSQTRVASITPDMNAEIMINMLGAPYEDVTLRYIEDGELKVVTCNLGIPGTQTMSLVTGRCPF